MKESVTIGTVACAACLMMSTLPAMAHDRSGVRWSVTIGSSYPGPIYGPPPVVYVPAQPVYVPPPPVYVQPYPSYVQPHPTYIIPRPIYVQPAPPPGFGRNYNERHWHPHNGHEQRQFRSYGPHHRPN